MDYYAIGQRIRTIRKARGLPQEALAERAGISVTHMSHIETGSTKLSLPVLAELAAALNASTDELLYGRTPAHKASEQSITQLLEGCSVRQLQVLEDILRTAKESMDRNL